jgi:choice-of-anchor B domain-containing protein
MYYFINSNKGPAIKKTLLLLCVSGLALGTLTAIEPATAEENDPVTEHDDGGNSSTIVKGTGDDACQSGVSSGFACKNVELLARLPLANIGGGKGADSWGWKDAGTGRYYAIMARSNGTSFVDVTDPKAPVYLGNLPSDAGESSWRDVKVYSNHAFIVADSIPDHGIQVFDLTRLRGLVSPREFTSDALYEGIGSAHNIAINEDSGFAYVVGSNDCSGGLHMVDIRTPKSPKFAGCYSADGYTHDVQCLTYPSG